MEKRNKWLRQAFEEEAASDFAPYMTQSHQFSPEFQKRMENLIYPPAPKTSWKQTAARTAAVILLGVIGLFGGYSTALAMDRPTIEAILNAYDHCVDLIFRREEGELPPPESIEE